MSCNFFTRLLPFRRRRQVPDAFVAPALPTTDKDLQTMTTPDFLFHTGSLSSYTLTIPEIRCRFSSPYTDVVSEQLGLLPGYIDFYIDNSDGHSTFDINIDFSTAEEAAMALARHPVIDFGDGVRRQLHSSTSNAQDIVEPPRKRIKMEKNTPATPLVCVICTEPILGDSTTYARPCFYCKNVWCLECIRNQFFVALEDQERFPAQCCSRILHLDVAKACITKSDYDKYQTRFEQFNTTKPLYCANALCSSFLPTRIAKPDDQGHVDCPSCTSTTCNICRTTVNGIHKCTAADELTALLKQYDYKRCPRCNTGVAKMYGCSHVRCQCGAHWCWDCQRPVQICWSKPCEQARQEGEESEDHDIPEEESEASDDEATVIEAQPRTQEVQTTVQQITSTQDIDQPASIGAVTETLINLDQAIRLFNGQIETRPEQSPAAEPNIEPAVSTVVPSEQNDQPPAPTAESLINLDAEDFDDWEAGSFDFGDEPQDESWDTWGCMHNWNPVQTKAVFEDYQQWLPNINTATDSKVKAEQITCLRCYKLVDLIDPTVKPRKRSKSDSTKQSQERPDSACDLSTPIAEGDDEAAKKKKRKAKKAADTPVLFNCAKCGMFYCKGCKKASTKEIRASLNDQLR